MTAELADSLRQMNLTLENYLNHISKTPEELKRIGNLKLKKS